jgi:hypothetical protein
LDAKPVLGDATLTAFPEFVRERKTFIEGRQRFSMNLDNLKFQCNTMALVSFFTKLRPIDFKA